MIAQHVSAPLGNYFREVFLPLRPKIRAKRTIKLYLNTIDNFERYLGCSATLDHLNDDTVTGFMAWHLHSKSNTSETANKEAGQLLCIWRFADSRRHIDRLPTVQLHTVPKRVPRAWLKEDLDALFAAAALESGFVDSVRASLWWQALICMVWITGERIGAVMQVRWSDVDLHEKWVVVPAEIRKGGRSDKAFALNLQTIQALQKITLPTRDLVFPWHWSETYIYAKYKKILERAGLPTDRRSKFHRIRRSTASYCKAGGGDPTELLDHTDPRTTKKYLDPRICGSRSAAEILFSLGE